MALSTKVKTALDETRTLILGAQILLGFQYQGVFRPRFDSLPFIARIGSGCALALLLVAVGLLIAPSAFHRIAAGGETTGRMMIVTGRCAALALVPFAIALGLDLDIALWRAFGGVPAGMAIGTGLALLALIGWFGVGWIMKQCHGGPERREAASEQGAREAAPLHARIEQMLTEARVIIPGGQALLGFQLVIVLTDLFDKLPPASRLLHGLALISVALSVILLMTPAALHRIVWVGEDSETLLRLGGRIIGAALLPLAFGMAADSYVVFARIAGSATLGIAATLPVLLCLLGLWFAWPIAARHRRDFGTRATRLG